MVEAKLTDMSCYFALTFCTNSGSGKPEVSWEVRKVSVTGAAVTAIFRSALDADTLRYVKFQFEEFARWW